MKKLLALLVLALIGLMILSSCQGKKDEPTPPQPTKRDWLDGSVFGHRKYDRNNYYDAVDRINESYGISFGLGQAHFYNTYIIGERSKPPYSVRTVEAIFTYSYDKPHCALVLGVSFENVAEYDAEGKKTYLVRNRKIDFAKEYGSLSLYVDEATRTLYLTTKRSDQELLPLR